MKKLFVMTALAMMIAAPHAYADGHEKGGKKFEKHDTNGDGVISKSEFLAQAEERFAKMDVDGNGEISKEEGKAAREARKGKMKERMEKRKEKRNAE